MPRSPHTRTKRGWCRPFALTLLLLVSCWATHATEPQVKWIFKAESNLYAAPLVADMTPSPGQEIVISDAEARKLRCLSAQGEPLWEYDGGWKKRLVSAAALSDATDKLPRLLAIANGDGRLCCVEAATGKERWQVRVGAVEWGGTLWADLNGDGQQEIVVGTERRGILAIEADDGAIRWHYNEPQEDLPLEIPSSLAACDIDGDGKCEVFACGKWGPLVLDPQGKRLWQYFSGDAFIGAPVVADTDGDGRPEVYCVSRSADLLWRLDAATGEVAWRTPLNAAPDVYSGSGVALGDMDADGRREIVLCDAGGNVRIYGKRNDADHNDGPAALASFATDKPVHGAVTLADVNGDYMAEALVASGDHNLYCLDRDGRLAWTYAAGRRIICPPTVTDLDHDGRIDILFGSGDHKLHVLTLDASARPPRGAWPMHRYDVARTGASYGKAEASVRWVKAERPLFIEGDFERDRTVGSPDTVPEDSAVGVLRQSRPLGWHPTNGHGEYGLSQERVLSGSHALRIAGRVSLRTDLIAVPATLRTVKAELHQSSSAPISAYIEWLDAHGRPHTAQDQLENYSVFAGSTNFWGLSYVGEKDGWRCYASEIEVPREARSLRLAITYLPDDPAFVDAVQLVGVFSERADVTVLANQTGYDASEAKAFTVASNFAAETADFALLRDDGEEVWTGPLEARGRTTGHFGNDWGHEYYCGDFSDFDEPGMYRVEARLDGIAAASWPFEIRGDLLWAETSAPAYRFFYYQRCGMAIPGFHAACHLDDAATPDGTQYECWGGWHDAGDYNTYHNAPYVYGLLRAYGIGKEAFDQQDEDKNGRSDFLDEIVWGAEHVRRMIAEDGSARGTISSGYGFWGPPELETDNKPGTGDERRLSAAAGANPDFHHATLARLATYMQTPGPWADAAARSLRWALDQGRRGVCQLSTALDLYIATRDAQYAELAKELCHEIGVSADPALVDVLQRYDETFGETHTEALQKVLVDRAEGILKLAENPFGIYTFGPAENPNFFGTPEAQGGWHVGTSSRVLEAANLVALAHQYAPNQRYLAFVYDQFNWVLGNNPYNISLLEGCGSAFPPTYHHRYTFSGVERGAVPGSVANGITWRAPGDDRPFFDMSGIDIPAFEPNEAWLPHNTNYLNALANLQAAKGIQDGG